jgi:hypothetical protein
VPHINADIPPLKCFVRREFLFDLQEGHGEFEPAYAFGIASLRARAIGWHVMTNRGAQVARLPIHALVHKEDAPNLSLPTLELWDCFGYSVGVKQFAYLKGVRANALCGDGTWRKGEYLFTIDWCGGDADLDVSFSELPDEHKNAHVLRLDCGCFAALPNNRIEWIEGSFITNPLDLENTGHPGYRVNTHTWSVEGDWRTEDSDAYFYKTTED